jgi:hypothetical protein
MTTKPKPRKKAANPAASKDARLNNRSEIEKLLARHRFLEEDQLYQSAAAATAKESNRGLSVHSREIETIREKLASAVLRLSAMSWIFCNLRSAEFGRSRKVSLMTWSRQYSRMLPRRCLTFAKILPRRCAMLPITLCWHAWLML